RGEIREIEEKMDKIEDMLIDREIDNNTYNRMIDRYIAKKKALQDRIEIMQTPNRAKIEPQLKYAISLINNIDTFFITAPAKDKIKVLSSIFSGKLEFDGKNFRTEDLNSVLALIYQQTNELRNPKKESEESFSTFPTSVPGAGVEPARHC
ncbi:MAG: recombinase family protein, partial [Alistipes sp.]|nr:recombinase family protein [Alistipes sp.]